MGGQVREKSLHLTPYEYIEQKGVEKGVGQKGVRKVSRKVSVNGIAIFPLVKVSVQSAAELPIPFTDPSVLKFFHV
jgi:hypothetical protein